MTWASYILATHHRPRLLTACLERLARSVVPEGVEFQIVVATNADDRKGRQALREARRRHPAIDIVEVVVQSTFPGGKLTAAYLASDAGTILVTGDDDLQSPRRLGEALALHDQGAEICGIRRFRFLELATAKVARWEGPAVKVGAARSFKRHVLNAMNGWRDLPRGIDTDFQVRCEQVGFWFKERQLSPEAGLETVCLQHGANIWKDWQFPEAGETLERGDFLITGEGRCDAIADFPEDVRTWYESGDWLR